MSRAPALSDTSYTHNNNNKNTNNKIIINNKTNVDSAHAWKRASVPRHAPSTQPQAQHMLRGGELTSTSKIAPPVSPNAGFASAVGRSLVAAAASCITVAPAPSRRAAVSRGTSRRGAPRANSGSGALQCVLCRAALPRSCAKLVPNVKPAAGDRTTAIRSSANAALSADCGPMLILECILEATAYDL